MAKKFDEIAGEVVSLARKRDPILTKEQLMLRLVGEVGELARSLRGMSPYSATYSLQEIAATCLSWIRKESNVDSAY